MAIAILPVLGRGIAGHSPHVPLLVDPSVAVLRLVTALASTGLTIRHDHRRNALVVSTTRPQEGMHK